MEQDNKEKVEAVVDAEEVFFWNKPVFRMIALVAIVCFYIFYWVPRQECISMIYYYPATESVPSDELGSLGKTVRGFLIAEVNARIIVDERGKSEHYSYRSRDFKTRQEAISYCLAEREN